MEKNRNVEIFLNRVILDGELVIPDNAKGIVIFAHGSGSGRLSPRNCAVARVFHKYNIGTLLFDLLTKREDQDYENRFNINLLKERLVNTTLWLRGEPEGEQLPLGYFGASTGAAAALKAAAVLQNEIEAVVSRGGRPDLAGDDLGAVRCPTLLIVGGLDKEVISLNDTARECMTAITSLRIIDGAGHLFEEPGKLDEVAKLAADWFTKYFSSCNRERVAQYS